MVDLRKNQKASIIEFIGLPGCGKSTISASIIEHYDNLGIPTVSTESLVFGYKGKHRGAIKLLQGFFNREDRHMLLGSLRFLAAAKPPAIAQTIFLVRHVRMAYEIHAKAKTANHVPIILEEGFLQNLWAATARPYLNRDADSIRAGSGHVFPQSVLRQLIQQYCIFHKLIILIKVSPSESHQRISTRLNRHSPFDYLDEEKCVSIFNHTAHHFDQMADHLRKCGIKVLELEASSHPDVLKKLVLESFDEGG